MSGVGAPLRRAGAIAALPRAGATVVRGLSPATLRRALTPGPRARRRLAALAALTALVAAVYLLWLRDSSFVRVETVTVTGLTAKDSGQVRAALESAARQMTTLHVDAGRLERAALAFPAVRAIEVRSDFPSGLRIHVFEHRPAAIILTAGRRVPVAGDGSILSELPVERPLPEIRARGSVPAEKLGPGAALDAVRVAGSAPAALAPLQAAVKREDGPRGVVVILEHGPELVFGEPTAIAAKWAAVARVLADPDAAGATYVDVRIPGRPVAGGLGVETVAPVAPAGTAEPVAPGAIAPAAPEAVDPAAETPVLDPVTGLQVIPAPAAPEGAPDVAPPGLPAPAEPLPRAAPSPAAEAGGGASPYPQP